MMKMVGQVIIFVNDKNELEPVKVDIKNRAFVFHGGGSSIVDIPDEEWEKIKKVLDKSKKKKLEDEEQISQIEEIKKAVSDLCDTVSRTTTVRKLPQ